MQLLLLSLFGAIAIVKSISFYRKLHIVRNHSSTAPIERPSLSIVVAAHDEINNLNELVPVLLSQDYPDYEVIICLDRSSDQSLDYLQSLDADKLKILDLKSIPENWNSKKFALKSGIESARGTWILLTDADCRLTTDWAREMASGMTKNSGFVIGISPYLKKTGLINQLIQFETFSTSLEFIHQALIGRPYMGLGRNMAYRKSLFNEIKGFQGLENITGGDDDLIVQKMSQLAKCEVVLTPNSVVESIPKTSWKEYFHQKTRHYSVGKFYPKRVKARESARWFIQILFWMVFFVSLAINPLVSVLIFTTYYLIRIISINIVANRLEKRFNLLWLPFVDLIYSFLLPIIGLKSLLVKSIKWN